MGWCEFEWVGALPWIEVDHHCDIGANCTPPAQPGTMIGQRETVECTGPGKKKGAKK